jgi:hypothetical protein
MAEVPQDLGAGRVGGAKLRLQAAPVVAPGRPFDQVPAQAIARRPDAVLGQACVVAGGVVSMAGAGQEIEARPVQPLVG